MRIFYLTRTYPAKTNGGGIARYASISSFKKNGYDVWIIAPNYNKKIIEVDNELQHILIPYNNKHRIYTALEYCGIFNDYLERWAIEGVKHLKKIVTGDDIVFATSGGELGCIIMGKLLKDLINCKFIVHLHDPIDFTMVFEQMTVKGRLPHVVRDKAFERSIISADAIITSTAVYQGVLQKKYPGLCNKIICNHMGYSEPFNKHRVKENYELFTIVYGGSMGDLQTPEILAEAADGIDNVRIIYVGDWESNEKLKKLKGKEGISLIDRMPHDQYIDFFVSTADIGFVSLRGIIAELCIPYKMYELINFGIPILAAIKGDTKNIIENNKYGVVTEYTRDSLRDGILKIINQENYMRYKENVMNDRGKWSMESQIKGIVETLKTIGLEK